MEFLGNICIRLGHFFLPCQLSLRNPKWASRHNTFGSSSPWKQLLGTEQLAPWSTSFCKQFQSLCHLKIHQGLPSCPFSDL
uniref:Uncharacterized protein n=1 Tax=Salix viminalis TaxID=40686 RepID=A0A6N2N9X2_SALVM